MPQDATVNIDVSKIPPWTAEYLTECLYKSVCNFFSVPENQAKFERWKRERDARRAAEAEADTTTEKEETP